MESECCDCPRPNKRPSSLNLDRQLTNKAIGIIFITSFLLWLVAVMYAMSIPADEPSTLFMFSDTSEFFSLIGYIFLSAVLTLLTFIAFTWTPHVTKLMLCAFWIQVLVYTVTSFSSLYAVIGSIFSSSFILTLLKTEWFHFSDAVLKEACKMIISVPSTVTFVLLSYLINVSVLIIIFIAFVNLTAIRDTLITMISVVIIFFIGTWTIITITALSWMTLSGTFAEYCFAENKSSVCLGTVCRLFKINCRYHIGTAAMYHPLLGGVRSLFYLATQAMYLILDGASKTGICLFVLNIFDPVIFRVVLLGSATACGIKGKNFYNSMEHAMTLITENPKKIFLVTELVETMIVLSGMLIWNVIKYSTYGYFDDGLMDKTSTEFFEYAMMMTLLFIATLFTCLSSACYTIIICLHEEKQGLTNTAPPYSYFMNPDLHVALNHNGAPNWFLKSCGRCIPND